MGKRHSAKLCTSSHPHEMEEEQHSQLSTSHGQHIYSQDIQQNRWQNWCIVDSRKHWSIPSCDVDSYHQYTLPCHLTIMQHHTNTVKPNSYFGLYILHIFCLSLVSIYTYTGWLKKSKLLTQYNSLLFLSHPVYINAKKTYQFKTQCKGDIRHAFETAKITVYAKLQTRPYKTSCCNEHL